MPKTVNRIKLDTNLWISFFLSNDYSKLDILFNSNKVLLLFSEELLNEFTEVAKRPKFKKYFTTNDLNALLISINSKAKYIKVFSKIFVCRDMKDNFLLALSKDGKADFLITGDKDLLDLEKFESTQILTMSNFLNII